MSGGEVEPGLTRDSSPDEIAAAAAPYTFRGIQIIGPFWHSGGELAILLDGYFSRDDLVAVLRIMDKVRE